MNFATDVVEAGEMVKALEELGAVAVRAVALVPLFVLAKRVVDAQSIPGGAEAFQPGFHRRREQQPVVVPRHDRSGRFERGHQMSFRRRVQLIAQRARGVADIKGIHLSGFIAWWTWLIVHLWYLIGFQNRVLVVIRWAFSFFTHGRGARLIAHD